MTKHPKPAGNSIGIEKKTKKLSFPVRLNKALGGRFVGNKRFQDCAGELELLMVKHIANQHRTAVVCAELARITGMSVRDLVPHIKKVGKEMSPSWLSRLIRTGDLLRERVCFSEIRDLEKLVLITRIPNHLDQSVLSDAFILTLPGGREVNVKWMDRAELQMTVALFREPDREIEESDNSESKAPHNPEVERALAVLNDVAELLDFVKRLAASASEEPGASKLTAALSASVTSIEDSLLDLVQLVDESLAKASPLAVTQSVPAEAGTKAAAPPST